MALKICACCQQSKPLAAFGRNRQAIDGLHYYCKVCAAARQRAWSAQHQDKIKAKRTAYLKRIREQNAGRDPYAETPS